MGAKVKMNVTLRMRTDSCLKKYNLQEKRSTFRKRYMFYKSLLTLMV
jgi:hypothetical protein